MNAYKRILLKLSGEALSKEGSGIELSDRKQQDKASILNLETCIAVAKQVKQVQENGTEIAIVIGGGNVWRGRDSKGIDRTKADQIGTLATVMNCIYFSEVLRNLGLETVVMTPFVLGNMTKLFSKDEALEHLFKKKIVLLAGGTGHPYFSTDTASALRAIELEADMIVMARDIDGVYDDDPAQNKEAVKFPEISYSEMIERKLKILDMTAMVMCRENKIPSLIFSLQEPNSIVEHVKGNISGSIITEL